MLDKNKYQVFLCSSACPMPVSFAVHTWLVVNNNGAVSRFEIFHKKNVGGESFDYLHKDFYPPFHGIRVFPFSGKYFWGGKVLGSVQGDLAQRMGEYILNSKNTYPFVSTYNVCGPNSNTYTAWVLHAFPEFKIALPKRAIGKGYKIPVH